MNPEKCVIIEVNENNIPEKILCDRIINSYKKIDLFEKLYKSVIFGTYKNYIKCDNSSALVYDTLYKSGVKFLLHKYFFVVKYYKDFGIINPEKIRIYSYDINFGIQKDITNDIYIMFSDEYNKQMKLFNVTSHVF